MLSNIKEIEQLLAEVNRAGKFPVSVLADAEGFPIAWYTENKEYPGMQSAVAALIQKTSAQVESRLGMANTNEVSVFDDKGQRLVCRPFQLQQHPVILAVWVPNRNQKYRRLTNRVIRNIQQLWSKEKA